MFPYGGQVGHPYASQVPEAGFKALDTGCFATPAIAPRGQINLDIRRLAR